MDANFPGSTFAIFLSLYFPKYTRPLLDVLCYVCDLHSVAACLNLCLSVTNPHGLGKGLIRKAFRASA